MSTPVAPPRPSPPPPESRPPVSPPPRRRHPVAITLAAAFSALLLSFGVYAVVGLPMRQERTTTWPVVGPVSSASIATDGAIRVGVAQPGSVVLDQTWAYRPPRVHLAVDGERLAVSAGCATPLGLYCDVDATVLIPAAAAVDARSTGGSVTMTGLAGSVSARSSGGGISLGTLSGQVVADSSGGAITGRDLRGGSTLARSSGGGILLAYTQAPTSVDASSSGGGVTVVVPDDGTAYRVDASSSGGGTSVTVRTDPSSAHTIYVRSSGGGVTVCYP